MYKFQRRLGAGIVACALVVAACGTGSNKSKDLKKPVTVTGISFSQTPAPTDQYASGDPNAAFNMSIPYTASIAVVSYSDGTNGSYPLQHNFLFKSSDVIPHGKYAGQYFGGVIDINGDPVIDTASALENPQFVADTPDGSVLIKIPDSGESDENAGKLYYLNNFEYVTHDADQKKQYGKNPMFIGLSTISQDLGTGMLAVEEYTKINLTEDHGLWIPCAASLSPWNTFLGSEEYEPDEAAFDSGGVSSVPYMDAFVTRYGDPEARPYNYGYVTEVTIDKDSEPAVVKHYASGRWARELIRVMPDMQTYYSGDDGKSTALYMGIADNPGDLSAVTLYAAKFNQTSKPGDALGSGALQWIKLGHATEEEVKEYIDGGIHFAQIFDAVVEPLSADVSAEQLSGQGYRKTFNYYHPVSKGKAEWLRLKPGMKIPAAFLETHRYAAYVGATTEFTKMEGVAMDKSNKMVYLAISYQYKSMSDDEGDVQFGGVTAGATYEMPLSGDQQDSLGAPISSSWVATGIKAVPELLGRDNALNPVTGKRTPDAQGNLCVVDSVANPDNLKFSTLAQTLFIGEDSNCHVNNFVWAFNVVTRKLSRILSLPMGAEATGLMAVDDRNGYMYIGANYQHPGDSGVGAPPVAMVKEVESVNSTFSAERNRAGGVGYIRLEGMPRMGVWHAACDNGLCK